MTAYGLNRLESKRVCLCVCVYVCVFVCAGVCVCVRAREALYFDLYHVLALEHAVLAILASCREKGLRLNKL